MKSPFIISGGLMAVAMLASCAAVKNSAAAVSEKTKAMAANIRLPDLADTPVARLMPAGGLKVVEPREEHMETMPTGHEKALAFRENKRRGFWFFGGPVDFEEPPLPEAGSDMDGSLLPPLPP
jgi:hypothetical protein